MPNRNFDHVLLARDELMQLATLDTKRYCVAPDTMVGRYHSDQFWMEVLAPNRVGQMDAALAHKFLVSFQLTNRIVWDKALVANEIRNFALHAPPDPVLAIMGLANGLRGANRRGTRQTSAASKTAMLGRPMDAAYIWDKLAACSARGRDWHRQGRPAKRHTRSVFLDKGEHDYAAHHAACARALADEREREDFQAAVVAVEEFLKGVGGPMANRDRVPIDFTERRLLDKLRAHPGISESGIMRSACFWISVA